MPQVSPAFMGVNITKHSELSNFIIAKISQSLLANEDKLVQVSTDHLFAGTTSLNNEHPLSI